jgi:death-on-curing protein
MVIPLSVKFLKVLHNTVLEDDPTAAVGYRQESMIEGSMQRALTRIYGYEPFQSIIDKAAALMFSINVFHPFTDGCKRTSLLAVHFFLLFNGYQFMMTEDCVTLTLKIANREIQDEKIVSDWLRRHCRKNLILRFYSRFIFPKMHTSLHRNELFIATIALPLLEYTKKIWPKV